MTPLYHKVGKSRYRVTLPDERVLFVFKDFYSGLWRARTDGGPFDYFSPRQSLTEMKEKVQELFED